MEKLNVSFIFEIMGRPAEHIKDALNSLLMRIGSEKGVKVLSKNIHEPKKIEGKDLYTSFAELNAELDSLEIYFGILFAYMPAHVEIISPENISLTNIYFNELGNKLLARLHDYDAITKKSIFERNMFAKKLQEVAPHLFEKKEIQQENNKPESKPAKHPKEKKKKAKANKKK